MAKKESLSAGTESVTCPYCAAEAALVTGEVIYPQRADLAAFKFWQCAPCDAYVGCHKPGIGHGDGTRPLGRLANAQLRRAKMAVHAAFDPLWSDGMMSRRAAYAWLAGEVGLAVDACHIGAFDVAQCEAAVAAVNKLEGQSPLTQVARSPAPAQGGNSAMAAAFERAKAASEELSGVALPIGWRWRYVAGSSVCVVVGPAEPDSAKVCIDFKRRIFGLGAQPPLEPFNDINYIGNGWMSALVRDAVGVLSGQ